jgi:hypothetical protein
MEPIKCQKCGKEFTPKKETAKFCSVSCRVGYHKKHGKKNTLNPVQVQVLYNTIMEKLGAIQFSPATAKSYDGSKLDLKGVDEAGMFPKQSVQPRTFTWYMQAKNECEHEDEWRKLERQIQADPLLSTKQKNLLLKPH